jgi:hypothetical protein
MKIRRSVLTLCSLAASGWFLGSNTARAETFILDATQSVLTVSAQFSSFDVAPQAPGSLTTTYTGAIEADVTGSSIMFVGGSLIAAANNGTWQPGSAGLAGSAPANYGGQVANLLVNGKAALRNVLMDLTSDVLPVSGGTFPSLGLQFNFVPTATSVVDYSYSITFGDSGNGSQVLTGTLTNSVATNATVVAGSAGTVLTIPVDIAGSITVISTNDLQYRFRGQLVGRASAVRPLQITSFQVAPGQLNFTISTTPGQTYTILGSTDLRDWPVVIDQFTATNNPTERAVVLPASLPQQYFRVRQD